MTRPMPAAPRTHGFTLVEAVIVIAIIGIIGAIVAVFIRVPILNYRDSVDRAELTDQADLALRRMARDIRLALPNSVRVNGDGSALELLQTRSGARYLAADDGVDPSLVLSFDDAGKTSFAALAPPGSFSQVRVGDYVVVSNLGKDYDPADAYQIATGAGACPGGSPVGAGNIAPISALAAATDSIAGQAVPTVHLTLACNPFAKQDIELQSPQRRFQVVSGPVSFYCAAQPDGTLALWRAWGYPISGTQAVPGAGQRALVATRLTHCDGLFSDSNAAAGRSSQRSALVSIALELHGRNDGAPAIRLVHQVHVDNTP